VFLDEALIESFVQRSGLSPEIIGRAKQVAGQDAFSFAAILIKSGKVSRDLVGMVLGDSIHKAYMNLEKTLFQTDVVNLISKSMAQRLNVIPIYKLGGHVTLAMTDPEDLDALVELSDLLGGIDVLLTLPDELEAAISVHYQNDEEIDALFRTIDLDILQKMSEERKGDQQAVVKLADAIILLALKECASDIHLEPKADAYVVRFRVDGVLLNRLELNKDVSRALVSRYKIMSELDISERRKPQDGRTKFSTSIKQIDIRVSMFPSIHGETVVMRLLGALFGGVELDLDKQDISPHVLEPLKGALARPNGLILVTGPTGSGKSTTLYGALNLIERPEVKIMTIEDPVEYEVPQFTQCQVDPKAGRSFPVVMRAALRQDPDVILVGEIRDEETAGIASEAALTGHLVLSTLHANNALQGVTRLLDMGIEPYVIGPSLAGILAQRLVRRLCDKCRYRYQPEERELQTHFHWPQGMPLPELFKADGCASCGGSGFRGRVGIHEFMRVNQAMRNLIIEQADFAEVVQLAVENGYQEMRYDGFGKALQGLTTLDEVIRVTATD